MKGERRQGGDGRRRKWGRSEREEDTEEEGRG